MEQPVRIPNIGPRERHRRVIFGIISLVLSLSILVALIALDAGRWWRLSLFVPLFMSMLGFFQAREKT